MKSLIYSMVTMLAFTSTLAAQNGDFNRRKPPTRAQQKVLDQIAIVKADLDTLTAKIEDNSDFRYVKRNADDVRRELADLSIEASESISSRAFKRQYERFNEELRNLRSEFHETRIRGAVDILDIWYDLMFESRLLTKIINETPSSGGGDDCDDDLEEDEWLRQYEFKGDFGNLTMRFSGTGILGVYQNCRDTGATARLSVNSFKINDASAYTGTTKYSGDELCAIAALNSKLTRQRGEGTLFKSKGTFASLPFSVEGNSLSILRRELSEVMVGLGEIRTNSITVNGASFYAGTSAVKRQGLEKIIAYSFERPSKRFVSKGNLAGYAPFVFADHEISGLQRQCSDYFRSVFGDSGTINSLTVNGENRYGGTTRWDVDQTCMTVSAMAQERPGHFGRPDRDDNHDEHGRGGDFNKPNLK